MAVLVFLFGGICGTILGFFGWLFLGMGLMGALQLYLVANIAVILTLLVAATLRQVPEMEDLQDAEFAS